MCPSSIASTHEYGPTNYGFSLGDTSHLVKDRNKVMFVPDGHEKGAVGTTDVEGRFRLMIFALNDGAVPGNYTVSISKFRSGPSGEETDGAPEFEDQMNRNLSVQKSLLPERYSDAQKSGLTATVTESGPNEFKFDLKN